MEIKWDKIGQPNFSGSNQAMSTATQAFSRVGDIGKTIIDQEQRKLEHDNLMARDRRDYLYKQEQDAINNEEDRRKLDVNEAVDKRAQYVHDYAIKSEKDLSEAYGLWNNFQNQLGSSMASNPEATRPAFASFLIHNGFDLENKTPAVTELFEKLITGSINDSNSILTTQSNSAKDIASISQGGSTRGSGSSGGYADRESFKKRLDNEVFVTTADKDGIFDLFVEDKDLDKNKINSMLLDRIYGNQDSNFRLTESEQNSIIAQANQLLRGETNSSWLIGLIDVNNEEDLVNEIWGQLTQNRQLQDSSGQQSSAGSGERNLYPEQSIATTSLDLPSPQNKTQELEQQKLIADNKVRLKDEADEMTNWTGTRFAEGSFTQEQYDMAKEFNSLYKESNPDSVISFTSLSGDKTYGNTKTMDKELAWSMYKQYNDNLNNPDIKAGEELLKPTDKITKGDIDKFRETFPDLYYEKQESIESKSDIQRVVYDSITEYNNNTTRGSEITPSELNSLYKIMNVESSGNPDAKAKTSSATGLFQIIKSTFDNTVADGKEKGVLDKNKTYDRRNPSDNAIVAGLLYKNNKKELQTSLGYEPNDRDMYLAHFLGSGSAVKVINANPSSPVSSIVSADKINANQSVFKDIKTIQDLLDWSSRKMS